MELSVSKMLNLMLVIDSFEYVRPLNLEPNTLEEINYKSSLTDDRKGKIFKKIKLKLIIKRYFNYNSSFLRNIIIISASLLLRMLSHCLSDNVFHTGLAKYFEKQLVKYIAFLYKKNLFTTNKFSI